MNSKEEALKKVLEGEANFDELTADEKQLFEGEKELSDLGKILSTAGDWDIPLSQDQDSSWNQILDQTQQVTPHRKFSWLSIAAAVSMMVLMSYFLFFVDGKISIKSGIGEIANVELPDGSTVTLNALSSISYNESGRKVWLSGKARFDVVSGSSFEVITKNFTTTVLGTSFDVSYNKGELEVSCYSGKVKVSDGNEDIELEMGERAYAMNGDLSERKFNIEANRRWVEGEFYFENTSFDKVVAEFEKQFDIEVVGLPEDTRIYDGYFYKDNLNEALDLIFKPMGYDYKLNNKEVVIK